MIPEDRLNPLAPLGAFLYPDSLPRETNRRIDYELGGSRLYAPPEGVPRTVWSAQVESDGRLTVGPWPSGAATTLLTGLTDCTEVSLCFDSNMRPHLAWVAAGQASWYWFDSQTQQATVTALDPEVRFPRLTLDDKRELQSGSRDILLCYVRGQGLYYRQQRERYLVERHLADLPADLVMLGRVGMANTRRVQFEYLVPHQESSSSS